MSALLLLFALLAGDPRAFAIELELVGPLDAVVVDAGPVGRSRIELELVAGERRRVDLALPLVLPFGVEGVTLPALDVTTSGGGSARVLGWSTAPTTAGWPASLLRRPRPPLPEVGEPEAGKPARAGPLLFGLALTLAAFAGGRRGAVVALVGMPLLGAWVATRTGTETERIVLEVDLALGRCLEVVTTAERVAWTGTARLEVEPTGAPLELLLDLRVEPPTTSTTLAGAKFVTLRPRILGPGSTLEERLDVTWAERWTRTPAGEWSDAPSSPPGWLSAGLPQGLALVVGFTSDGRWVRSSGP